MNLNNLKPAWRQILVHNSIQPIDPNEILVIIEQAEYHTKRRLYRFLTNTTMFITLTVCCQGG